MSRVISCNAGCGCALTRTHAAQAPRQLEPVVVEADADALARIAVGVHFVAQPTLEQQQLPGTRGDGDPRSVAAACIACAWRCGHEALEPRILELQAGCARGHCDVVDAAERRVRVQV